MWQVKTNNPCIAISWRRKKSVWIGTLVGIFFRVAYTRALVSKFYSVFAAAPKFIFGSGRYKQPIPKINFWYRLFLIADVKNKIPFFVLVTILSRYKKLRICVTINHFSSSVFSPKRVPLRPLRPRSIGRCDLHTSIDWTL
jgi:hypothetical protein